MELDKTDKAILNIIQGNARISHKEISEKLYLTRTPIFERIKKMERAGIISKYITLLNPKKINRDLQVFCFVTIAKHGLNYVNDFQNQVAKFKVVMECFHVAGNFDFLMKVMVKDVNEYQQFVLTELSTIKNISHVQSSFVLGELKHELAFEFGDS